LLRNCENLAVNSVVEGKQVPSILNQLVVTLGPTFLVVLGGIVTWFLKAKNEELKVTQEKLNSERTELYRKMLEPYVRLLASSSSAKETDKSVKQIQSFDWQNASTHLILFGSDEVIRAWNNFAQYNYRMGEDSEKYNVYELLNLYGHLLLAIRKDVGNKKTKLKAKETMMWKIRDINQIFPDS